ncbi:sensor histidine kinase [Catenuloplanes atrovinosus]|uniref:histidine kinase n=1 Tax=Catenuloplanes atrovinosus TaxID=137266 RepID=A0AAE3YQP3_9ACTN|nr:histidine kinase [Catenuloplanes atrovinosus]MDR7276663.1 signal transduction histidine kinase [Catenuloplanes atrovinosus]
MSVAEAVQRRLRIGITAVERAGTGMWTGTLALLTLWPLALALVLPRVAPFAMGRLRAVADVERRRLGLPTGLPPQSELRAVLTDPATGRELRWLGLHATVGFFLGAVGLTIAIDIVRDGLFPLYWRFVPAADATPAIGWPLIRTQGGAWLVGLMGAGYLLLTLYALPYLVTLQELPGRRLLRPAPGEDMAMRIAELTATRAAALDAHAVELRRIERALHDGTQNRLVAVNVLLGAARRAVRRDPDTADEILERAQSAAELALAELRGVVRSILPPVLSDRSLPDALASLAATCPVPVTVDADVPGRCAASVEATAYFVAAEALTNVAKHSGASRASITLTRAADVLRLVVTDDGHGGADADGGTGLTGIRRRAEAHDGTVTLTSPVGGPTTVEVELPCGL